MATKTAKLFIQQLSCKRCEHVWFPRSTEKPTICPTCKSPYWDKARKTA